MKCFCVCFVFLSFFWQSTDTQLHMDVGQLFCICIELYSVYTAACAAFTTKFRIKIESKMLFIPHKFVLISIPFKLNFHYSAVHRFFFPFSVYLHEQYKNPIYQPICTTTQHRTFNTISRDASMYKSLFNLNATQIKIKIQSFFHS